MKDKITIVIPCKNEERYIHKTLESISKQFNLGKTRIIIADAYSSDNTVKVINEAKNKFNLNLEIIEGGAVAVGRNRGAALVTTPYVLFIDADATLLNPLMMYNSVCLADEGYDLITAKLKSASDDILSKVFFSSFNLIQKYFFKDPFSTGVYFFTPKEKFNKLGGFDETVTQSEDYLLSRKYDKTKFHILDMYVGQDNRRFKKMGYFGFLKFLLKNYINRNNINYFKKDFNYWS